MKKNAGGPDVSSTRLLALADACAAELMVNGMGQKAERLVLISRNGRDLGGWGRLPLRDRILAAMQKTKQGTQKEGKASCKSK